MKQITIKEEVRSHEIRNLLKKYQALDSELQIITKQLERNGFGTCICCGRYPIQFAHNPLHEHRANEAFRICTECEKFCKWPVCKFRNGKSA